MPSMKGYTATTKVNCRSKNLSITELKELLQSYLCYVIILFNWNWSI